MSNRYTYSIGRSDDRGSAIISHISFDPGWCRKFRSYKGPRETPFCNGFNNSGILAQCGIDESIG